MRNGLISHLYFKDSSNFSNTFRPFNDSHSSCTPHVIMIDSFFPRCVSQRFDKIFTKIRNCRMTNFAIYIFKKRFRNKSYKILLEKLGNTVRVFLPKFSNARASQFRSPTGSWNRGGRGGGWILQNGSTSVKFLISALLSGIYTISIVSMRRWGERIRARGRGKGRKIAAPCNIDFRDEYGRPWCLVAGTNALAAELVFQIRNFEPPLGRY